jgi:hypothetical protein
VRHDRDVADDAAVLVEGQTTAPAIGGDPALDRRAVEHVLLEERALRFGHPLEEVQQRVEVLGRRGADLHQAFSL